jgi:hypothetical protein
MKSSLMTLAALAIVATFSGNAALAKAPANPPTDAQLKTFYAACIKVAPAATTLCKCKEEAAPKLIDTAFMDVVIASIKGKPLEAKYFDAYNDYIARSNQICKPEYM